MHFHVRVANLWYMATGSAVSSGTATENSASGKQRRNNKIIRNGKEKLDAHTEYQRECNFLVLKENC